MVEFCNDRYDVTRGEQILDEFAIILDKRVDLAQGVEPADELADLYYDEIFSKVDVSSHGL